MQPPPQQQQQQQLEDIGMDNWMELTKEQAAKRSWLAKGGSGWAEEGLPAPTGIPSRAAEPPAADFAGVGFTRDEDPAAAATLAEECDQGVQHACAALSCEDEAKQAWMAQADAPARRARLAEECALGVEGACVELSNEAPLTMGVQERQRRESAAAAYYNAQSVALPADNDEVSEDVAPRTAEAEAEAEAIEAWSAGLSFEPLRLSREEAARQAFAGGGARSPPGAYTIEELAGMASAPAAPEAPAAPAAPAAPVAPVVEQAAPNAVRSAASRAEMRAPPTAPIAAVEAAVVAVEAAASAAGLAVEAVAAAQAAEQAAEAEARAAAAQAVDEVEAARQQAVGAEQAAATQAVDEAEAARQQAVAAAAAVAMPAAAAALAVAPPPPNTREDEAKRAWLSNQGGVSAEVEAAALAEECDQGVEAAQLVESATARPTLLGCSAPPRREFEPSPSP